MMENSINGSSATAAHAETETTLLQIWSEVLNTAPTPIGIHDDFLGLGGDSLTAMRCINRIIATFSVEVPLDLFLIESATIAQVASEIARIRPNTGQLAERANA